jgi:hypothetical protein
MLNVNLNIEKKSSRRSVCVTVFVINPVLSHSLLLFSVANMAIIMIWELYPYSQTLPLFWLSYLQ